MKLADSKKKKSGVSKNTVYIVVIALLVLLIIITAAVVRQADDRERFESLRSDALARIAEGDYGTSLSYLRKAAAIDETEEILSLTADCYSALGNYDRALEALRKMDTGKSYVADRIQELEALKATTEVIETVTVNGRQYLPTVSSLVLEDSGLTDASLNEVVRLYSLTTLSVARNNISDISPLSALGGLTALDLSYNRITNINALASLTSLRTLYLDGNQISDYSPLYSLTGLTSLSIKETGITKDQRDTLTSALPWCVIHTGSSSDEAEDTDISLGGISFRSDSEVLSLSGLGISDINALSACTAARYLDLSGNSISDLTPLMSIRAPETLVLSRNRISNAYPLMGIGSITHLYLDGNLLTSATALFSLSRLTELSLANNSIKDFTGINYLNHLESLDISGNGLTDDSLTGLSECFSLKMLNITNNPELTADGVDELKSKLKFCNIICDDLPHKVIIGNGVYLDNAEVLDLSGQGITDVTPISAFTKLQELSLANNNITNIYSLEFIPNATKLTYLDLSGNPLSDILALRKFTGLRTLVLNGIPIDSASPLFSLTELDDLYISGCNLTDAQVLELCYALPNCNVHY